MKISIGQTARTGGLLYLINIAAGFFAIGYVPGVIVVSGNAAVTAQNILSHEGLYRLGLAAHVVILLTNVQLAVVFYALFKSVSKHVTLLVVFFTLVGTAVETLNLLNQFAPLILLQGGYLSPFPQAQLQALTYALFRLYGIGFNLALVFFGCYGLSIGYLIRRSAFLPPAIGLFMTIGGACYLLNSFANFIAPAFAAGLFPYIQLPSGLAELSFCLWLLVKGINEVKWRKMINDLSSRRG